MSLTHPSPARKREAINRRRAEKRAREKRRLVVWRCFWSWPLGHCYETPDGRGLREASSMGIEDDLRCVGCGRTFGLFNDYSS